ncbi:nitrous oxide reductase family maturation protein NosD [Oleisolibacter albus]|uniref:nitrous oxide reductase family maturation protein NosD n=1 Tax=Oleisolibacter albus TaxID=2171757 RepID=UPI001EFD2D74|nr:nitrous oxide reductase family maturation protein NosD [Oleisolibacter albus]
MTAFPFIRGTLVLVLLAGGPAAAAPAAAAATVPVAPGGLQAALRAAQPGDTLVLQPGLHPGPVVIATPLTLTAEPGAVIDGGGQGNSVTVTAPDVTLRGLDVRHSGSSLFDQNAGIFLDKTAERAQVESNSLTGNLIGIYAWGAADVRIRANTVRGRTDLRLSERGNGIQLWNAPGTQVVGNSVRDGRDGIFVTTSRNNLFKDNQFENVRFAIHYMYTNDSEISGNRSLGNHVGYALMYSHRLLVRDNLSRGDRQHGLLLNYANGSRIEGNVIAGRFETVQTAAGGEDEARDGDMPLEADADPTAPRSGTGKCVFIYNANKNLLRGNRFEGCEIGIHFTAGSERNSITGNAFIGNRTQVKYVGTRSLDWSSDGVGNYWSDNAAFDLDGDGIADEAYRPNDVVDRVVWAHPQAKLLLNSPGIQVIRWAQKQFPAIHPGGVVDSRPLMAPPADTKPDRLRTAEQGSTP